MTNPVMATGMTTEKLRDVTVEWPTPVLSAVRALQVNEVLTVPGKTIGSISSLVARVPGEFCCRSVKDGVKIWRVM